MSISGKDAMPTKRRLQLGERHMWRFTKHRQSWWRHFASSAFRMEKEETACTVVARIRKTRTQLGPGHWVYVHVHVILWTRGFPGGHWTGLDCTDWSLVRSQISNPNLDFSRVVISFYFRTILRTVTTVPLPSTSSPAIFTSRTSSP